jgi:hypothetical protein
MTKPLETIAHEALVTATGGDLRAATFGALALINASGVVTKPSLSVAKALQGPPPIVRIDPGVTQSPPAGSTPRS